MYLSASARPTRILTAPSYSTGRERWQLRGFQDVRMGRSVRMVRCRAPLHADLLGLHRGGGPVVPPAAETDFYRSGSVVPFARGKLAWPCSGSISVG